MHSPVNREQSKVEHKKDTNSNCFSALSLKYCLGFFFFFQILFACQSSCQALSQQGVVLVWTKGTGIVWFFLFLFIS